MREKQASNCTRIGKTSKGYMRFTRNGTALNAVAGNTFKTVARMFLADRIIVQRNRNRYFFLNIIHSESQRKTFKYGTEKTQIQREKLKIIIYGDRMFFFLRNAHYFGREVTRKIVARQCTRRLAKSTLDFQS